MTVTKITNSGTMLLKKAINSNRFINNCQNSVKKQFRSGIQIEHYYYPGKDTFLKIVKNKQGSTIKTFWEKTPDGKFVRSSIFLNNKPKEKTPYKLCYIPDNNGKYKAAGFFGEDKVRMLSPNVISKTKHVDTMLNPGEKFLKHIGCVFEIIKSKI